jgi:integrase
MTNLLVADVEDMGSAILVKVRDTENYKSRSFTILGEFYLEICRKYISIRKDIEINRFLVKYYNGKCAKMIMGKHKIGSAPREIVSFLKLPNCNEYTDHCLRRTSASLLVDNGGDISALKRHGGWRSTSVAESYILVEDSIENKKQTAMKILAPLDINKPSTSNDVNNIVDFTTIGTATTSNITKDIGIIGALRFENCTFKHCQFHVSAPKEI